MVHKILSLCSGTSNKFPEFLTISNKRYVACHKIFYTVVLVWPVCIIKWRNEGI